MRLTLEYGLPFVTASLTYRQKEVEVQHAHRRHHQPAPATA